MFTKENLNSLSNNMFLLFLAINSRVINRTLMLKGFAFPPSHMKVIFYLHFNGPSPVSKIAKELVISKPNMTPILDNLIAEGYARRYDDPNDRRIIMIESTEKACKFLEEKRQATISALSEKLSNLEQQDLETLDRIIPELTGILGKLQQ